MSYRNIMHRILIAESDSAFSEHMDTALRSQGYSTVVVYDGDDAWRHMSREAPGLLITDAALPSIDGFALVEKMRADSDLKLREVPVVMTVSRAMEADVFRGYQLGVATFQTREAGANTQFVQELLAKVKRILKSIDEDRSPLSL